MSGTNAPFATNPALVAIALAYRNAKLIADDVLPRVPVGSQVFRYLRYPIGTFFTPPETEVSRKGKPNTVEFDSDEDESQTVDQALDAPVPNADIELARSQEGMPDPKLRAAEITRELVALRREKRVADLVFANGTYSANNKVALAGNDRWDIDHADSNPLDDIEEALDVCVMRPNVMVIGRKPFSKLARHKTIVKAFHGNEGDRGKATREFIRELFELDEVLVGEGRLNIAKKGQPAQLVRVWGNHCALLHRNKNADTQGGTTFGYTAQWGGPIGGEFPNPSIGARGGVSVRIGESVKELSIANDLGFLLENVVS
jgi:hypothetical protein